MHRVRHTILRTIWSLHPHWPCPRIQVLVDDLQDLVEDVVGDLVPVDEVLVDVVEVGIKLEPADASKGRA